MKTESDLTLGDRENGFSCPRICDGHCGSWRVSFSQEGRSTSQAASSSVSLLLSAAHLPPAQIRRERRQSQHTAVHLCVPLLLSAAHRHRQQDRKGGRTGTQVASAILLSHAMFISRVATRSPVLLCVKQGK